MAAFLFLSCFVVGIRAQAHEATVVADPARSVALLADATAKRLHEHPVWLALLHASAGQAQIKAPQFFLTAAPFNPEAELAASLVKLQTASAADLCRFPARYSWLSQQLNFELLLDIDSACPEIKEFIQKAPFDRLDLVFADEAVTQPASILGHGFLKISGKKDEKFIEHAIAFYTDVQNFNLPKLLWESLISGKQGLFALTPYEDEAAKYLSSEQRNLWSYEIKTSQAERALIRNHLFELKQTELTYFFHSYNCATLLRNILSLTGRIPSSKGLWVTPKDVVKDVYDAGQVITVGVDVADAWLIANLQPHIANIEGFKQWMTAPKTDAKTIPTGVDLNQRQVHVLASAYNRWLLKNSLIDAQKFLINQAALVDAQFNQPTFDLQVNERLNPALSRPDSAWAVHSKIGPDASRYVVSFTPTSHALMDDQRGALAETQLQLLTPSVSVDARGVARIEEIKLFSMKSHRPRTQLLGGLSSQAYVGYGALSADVLDSRQMNAFFQLGLTERVLPAIDIYAIFGMGSHAKNLNLNFYSRADGGVILRHGVDAKTTLELTAWSGSQLQMRQVKVDQSWYVRSDTALRFAVMGINKDSIKWRKNVEMGLHFLF
jgi:Domain of unknown function (DUF4105)